MQIAEADMSIRATQGEPPWYHEYFLAMVENDRSLALTRIERAQEAIQERVAELQNMSPMNMREMQDLTSALIYLGILLMQVGEESESLLWD